MQACRPSLNVAGWSPRQYLGWQQRKGETMTTDTYDAWEAFQHAPQNYSVTLVNTTTGARLRMPNVVCGRQAYATATRHGELPRVFLGLRMMVHGESVATSFPERCAVDHDAHVHVHRYALPRTNTEAWRAEMRRRERRLQVLDGVRRAHAVWR